jgi:hypothetical protein
VVQKPSFIRVVVVVVVIVVVVVVRSIFDIGVIIANGSQIPHNNITLLVVASPFRRCPTHGLFYFCFFVADCVRR